MSSFSGTGVSAAQSPPAGGGDITLTLTNSSFVGAIYLQGSLDGGHTWTQAPTPIANATATLNVPAPVASMQIRLACVSYTSGTMTYSFAGLTSTVLGRLHVGAAESGASITTGVGAPTEFATAGSLYLRQDGSGGSRLYVCAGGTTWAAVATV